VSRHCSAGRYCESRYVRILSELKNEGSEALSRVKEGRGLFQSAWEGYKGCYNVITKEFFIMKDSFVLRVLSTLQALLIASILGTILLGASAVFALDDHGPFYFDEAGRIQQHGYWSPNARTGSDFETDRRQYNNQLSQDALKRNQETLEGYYSSTPAVPPSSSGGSYWVSPGQNGKPYQLCSPIAPRQVICQ